MKARGLCGAVFVFFASMHEARAQNADPFFYGDDAALSSGAVVASGRDSGSLWYNPAGFGGLRRGMLSGSASTFGVRIRKIPGALGVILAGEKRAVDLSSVDVISVPNAVVAGTSIGDRIGIAGGLLVTGRDLQTGLIAVPDEARPDGQGGTALVGQRLDLQVDQAKYHLGGAFAYELAKGLRVGAAVFATYAKQTETSHYSISLKRPPGAGDEIGFVTLSGRVTNTGIGATGSAGIQWQPTDLVALGLTLRAPEISLSSSADGGAVIATAAVGGTDPPSASYQDITAEPEGGFGKMVAPGRALLGVAFRIADASFVEVGVDVAHGAPASALAEAKQPQVNGRAGVRWYLSPEWIIGGGLFSDRIVDRNLGPFIGSARVDYYGLTAGVSKRTPLSLAKDPSPEALVLVTTLSLRAAAGFGQARAVGIDLDTNNNTERDDRADVVFYEIMPYLGSSILF